MAWNFFEFGLPLEGQPASPVWLTLGGAFAVIGLAPVWPVLHFARSRAAPRDAG